MWKALDMSIELLGYFFLLENALVAEVFQGMCLFHLIQDLSTKVAFGWDNYRLWEGPVHDRVFSYLAGQTKMSSDTFAKCPLLAENH